jgi:hypothetical protein
MYIYMCVCHVCRYFTYYKYIYMYVCDNPMHAFIICVHTHMSLSPWSKPVKIPAKTEQRSKRIDLSTSEWLIYIYIYISHDILILHLIQLIKLLDLSWPATNKDPTRSEARRLVGFLLQFPGLEEFLLSFLISASQLELRSSWAKIARYRGKNLAGP